MRFTLQRIEQLPYATVGRILTELGHICMTLEQPWRDNRPAVSCIPPGEYQVRWGVNEKWGPTLYLPSVPGRGLIRFKETELAYRDARSAIGIARGIEFRDGEPYGLDGGMALDALKLRLPYRGGPHFVKILPPPIAAVPGPYHSSEAPAESRESNDGSGSLKLAFRLDSRSNRPSIR